MRRKIVFVGISGGVDSAVTAALLKENGYEVVGVFVRTWHPDFIECNEEEERLDAMRVAAHLDIPFLTFDFQEEYKKGVADYMIAEYKRGRTPNPDVMCNKEIKFGAFLKKAISMGADYVATGHYAKKDSGDTFVNGLVEPAKDFLRATRACLSGRQGPEQKYRPNLLCRGDDVSKDQSYFLWTLKQEQLQKVLFPVGHLTKLQVRKLAKKFRLPVSEKKDSQGICFLGAVDLKDFLKHYIKEKRGDVVNESGETIGFHSGVFFHTLGERHGFTITKKSPNDKPYYVVGKDLKRNILYVSQERNFSSGDKKVFSLINTNWILEKPKEGKNYTAQIRYHGEFLPCKIILKQKNEAQVLFEKQALIASGQSVVFYDGEVCLGGGVVK